MPIMRWHEKLDSKDLEFKDWEAALKEKFEALQIDILDFARQRKCAGKKASEFIKRMNTLGTHLGFSKNDQIKAIRVALPVSDWVVKSGVWDVK